MSIPMYFALNWKESVNNLPWAAQTGFGFLPNGEIRLPEKQLPGSIPIIDDACLPPTPCPSSVLETFISLCTKGCYIDFEQPICAAQIIFLRELQRELNKDNLFAVPERLASYLPGSIPIISCEYPCNSWKQFLQQVQSSHSTGWMLELRPWSNTVETALPPVIRSAELNNAVCRYKSSSNQIQYYDTRTTINKRLSTAEDFGCIGGIILYQEFLTLAP